MVDEDRSIYGSCYKLKLMVVVTSLFFKKGSPAKNHQGVSTSSGMSTAGSVFLTLFFFCIPPAGFLIYVRRYGTGSGMNSFSNPNA